MFATHPTADCEALEEFGSPWKKNGELTLAWLLRLIFRVCGQTGKHSDRLFDLSLSLIDWPSITKL
jgi:hypothetical protein